MAEFKFTTTPATPNVLQVGALDRAVKGWQDEMATKPDHCQPSNFYYGTGEGRWHRTNVKGMPFVWESFGSDLCLVIHWGQGRKARAELNPVGPLFDF